MWLYWLAGVKTRGILERFTAWSLLALNPPQMMPMSQYHSR